MTDQIDTSAPAGEPVTISHESGWSPPAVAGLVTSILGAAVFLVTLVVEAASPVTFGATEYVSTLVGGVITMMAGSTASVVSNESNRKLREALDRMRDLEEKIASSS